jgi:(1->4)-alpha-D-glucan 1-alpha-D-glucosylmutase
MMPPTATYRLQLRGGMTFERTAALAPQLADLGISHLYLSPIFEAVRGSTHGYDVVDNAAIADELGGEAGFRLLGDVLRRHGIGLILDFVPNHMAASPQNPWWRDVLEWGAAARFAQYFDIDWSAPKLILPMLARGYGKTLAHGELGLTFDAATGAISLTYGDLKLPLTPPTYADILGRPGDGVLSELARRFAVSTPETVPPLRSALVAAAQEQATAALISRALDAMRTDLSALHALHERQAWRLTHWRAAREMLTHRRFFEIADLVGLKVEQSQVFDDIHARVIGLAKEGSIDGLRLDHIDGLADPKGYLVRLQAALGREGPFYLLVEKILGQNETLRDDWLVAGTTGYEFIRALAGPLVAADGQAGMTEAYHRFIGESIDYEALVRGIKRRTLTHNLATELRALTHTARGLAARRRDIRDLGPDTLRSAIVELVSALPLYRTYVAASGPDAMDRAIIEAAAREAKGTRQVDDGEALDFVKRLALVDVAAPEDQAAAQEFAVRFQQTSGALMAKAVEDTAFYRYNRLLALNEVGGEPGEFGSPLAQFHGAMLQRRERQPYGLSATATHDTKRGEDARARLYALSEMPDAWSRAASRWREQNLSLKRDVRGHLVPDPEAEWALYQALAGAWPPDLDPDDASVLAALAERMAQFALKAAREAKLHTSWTATDPDYEQGLEHFVRGTLDPKVSPVFLSDFARVLRPVVIAGALNALTQTLIKLAAPGVPDVYQGTELWDFSLVDPDNRRPVDFQRISSLAGAVDQGSMPADVHDWRSGAIKLHLLKAGLRLRAQRPALFGTGAYLPLDVAGDHCRRVVAFARVLGDDAAVAVAPKLALHLLDGVDVPMVPPARWGGTAVTLPAALANRHWVDVCTGQHVDAGAEVALGTILHICPVSLMLSTGGGGQTR